MLVDVVVLLCFQVVTYRIVSGNLHGRSECEYLSLSFSRKVRAMRYLDTILNLVQNFQVYELGIQEIQTRVLHVTLRHGIHLQCSDNKPFSAEYIRKNSAALRL